MRNYTVLRSRRSYGKPAEDAEQMSFVKEGFCWPALFVPLLWCLYHRLWLVMAVYLIGLIAILGVVSGFELEPSAGLALVVAGQALFAAEANDLLRWRLAARAYEVIGLSHGRNLFAAEMSYFEKWLQDVGKDKPQHGLIEADVSFRSTSGSDDLNEPAAPPTPNIGAPA